MNDAQPPASYRATTKCILADKQKAQICTFGPTEQSTNPNAGTKTRSFGPTGHSTSQNAETKTHGLSDAGHILPPLFLGFQLGVFVGGIHSLVNRLATFPIGPATKQPLATGRSGNFGALFIPHQLCSNRQGTMNTMSRHNIIFAAPTPSASKCRDIPLLLRSFQSVGRMTQLRTSIFFPGRAIHSKSKTHGSQILLAQCLVLGGAVLDQRIVRGFGFGFGFRQHGSVLIRQLWKRFGCNFR
jgi:hypothetical protein